MRGASAMIVVLGIVASLLTGCTPPAAGAKAAVQDWLTSLSQGRAADAMAYCTYVTEDSGFLSAQVLAASLAAAPMTGITVSDARLEASSGTYSVDVGYRLGDEQVNGTVVARPGKSWTIDEGCVRAVLLTASMDKGIPWDVNTDWLSWQTTYPDTMTLNGTPLTTTNVLLFPVAYQLGVDSPRMTMTGGHFVVTPKLLDVVKVDGAVVLDQETQRQIGATAASTLAGCLAERTETTTCGFGQTISYLGYDTATIRWGVVDTTGKAVGTTVDPTKWAWERLLNQPDRVVPAGDQYESDAASFYFRIISAKATRPGVEDITDAFTPYTTPGQPMSPCADFSDPAHPVVTFICGS